ncbi:MAG TPA: valine--tRNA ligase [Verrucomicrobiae bacterium]|nr:valine--tRNA ligase [Verrucomicrobiae bacterium]
MPTDIPKAYEPKSVEDKWYTEWLAKGYFTANPKSSKPAYSIVIPPPNVTGMLTMGHVLNNTLQDILARRKRMQGFEVLWLPGTDHASIATHQVLERKLRKEEGITKYDLGREKFLERAWAWKQQYGSIIIQQLKKLGCSCDWTRERFTMDDPYSRCVLQVFVDLYSKKLIYRGKRMVNWDPAGRTALSDEEVIMTETIGHLWHIKYPIIGSNDCVVVATTRPETMLGDEAVAVNPADSRYQHLIGKRLLLPLRNKEIPVIADELVDPKFGTGCVKVTPAHDPADYEMAVRHNLPLTVVIGPDGKMTAEAGEAFEELDRLECREAVVEQLRELGLLLKVEDYTHNVGYSERSNVPIEPYLSEQWFLRYPQVPRSADAVANGAIKLYPERWTKTYTHWMNNIRDWCISRQLWWGHRIPVWYRGDEIHCGLDAPTGDGWQQDPDVVDTWFSSWLWPFATMGWPEKTETLERFYPTTDLVTGPDIIFFWVARMIMAGYEYMGEKPFSNVYFTGIIRDAQGRKMSKSLGNSPDPLDLIAKYGADGLRFGLMLIAPQGQDILFDEKRCEVGRNFMNKLWNAARFIQMQRAANPPSRALNAHDLNVLGELSSTVAKANSHLDSYKFNEAAKELYDFVWGDFCDWYIEASKTSPNIVVLDKVFMTILKMLHPFAPFITEELWRGMGFGSETIQFAPWPNDPTVDGAAIDIMPKVQDLYGVVTAGRQLRNDYSIDPRKKVAFVIKPSRCEDFFNAEIPFLSQILTAETMTIDARYTADGLTPSLVTQAATVFMVGAVDVAQERARLTKQLADIEKQLAATDAKLDNANFVAKAAPIAVEREREKQNTLREQREKVQALLGVLQ